MHHFFFTKGICRRLIVLGLCLAVMLVPLPCHAAKKKKAMAPKAAKIAKTAKAAKITKTVKATKITGTSGTKVAAIPPSCPPGLPYQEEIQRFLGTPYRRGGTDSRGLDCSGLAQKFFSLVHGIELPHNSAAQSQLGYLEKVAPREDELEASDLLFFGPGKKRINHVGIYLADGKFLHASPKGGVVISDLDEAYWQKRLIGSRRLKESSAKAQAKDSEETLSFSYSDWRVKDAINAEQTLAMGVSHTVVDQLLDLNLGAFHTSSVSSADPEATYRQSLAEGYSDVDHRKGVRAFVDFTPSPWLRITPSLSVVDQAGFDGDNEERNVYGLETAISPPAGPWSLALSAHSSSSSGIYPWRLQAAEQAQRGVDLAFSVGYRFGDAMTLSVYGARDTGVDTAASESSRSTTAGMNDLAVQVHWTF